MKRIDYKKGISNCLLCEEGQERKTINSNTYINEDKSNIVKILNCETCDYEIEIMNITETSSIEDMLIMLEDEDIIQEMKLMKNTSLEEDSYYDDYNEASSISFQEQLDNEDYCKEFMSQF